MGKRVEFDAELSEKPTEKKNQKTGNSSSWVTRGVNLREDELQRLDTIAEIENVSRNGLMRLAITEWIKRYETGVIEIPKTDREIKHVPRKKVVID